MKLIYLANIRLPTEKAHGIQIMKTCEALAELGVEVQLVIPKRRNFFSEDPFIFYDVNKNFKIEKLFCLDFIGFPFFKKIFFWWETFTFYLSVKNYLAKNKSDIIYTRDLPLVFWLAKKRNNIFYEIHTLPANPNFRHKQAWLLSKGLVVISDHLKKDLVTFGVPKEKIVVARDAVDLNKFQITASQSESRRKLNLPLDKKIVLYTGHLYPWKGVDLLAKTAICLPEVEIYLVGGTKEDAKNFNNKYKFKNLKVVGWQNPELMPDWLNSADVLVLSNSAREKISSRYTSPMKLFEYLSVGKPIVASGLDSLKEILNENNAFLVEPDNLDALVEGIKKVLDDSALSASISVRAKKDAEQYTWTARARMIVDFLIAK